MPLFDPDSQVTGADGVRLYQPVDPTIGRPTAAVGLRHVFGSAGASPSRKQLIQLLFVGVVIERLVQFLPRLHLIQQVLLRPLLTQCLIRANGGGSRDFSPAGVDA